MRSAATIVALCLVTLTPVHAARTTDWSRFRGPNGRGVAETGPLPTEFAPDHNVVWKAPLPPGHSSPILTDDRIFLTAFEGEELLTVAVLRRSGEVLWRRRAPRTRREKLDSRNNPASPSPVTDGSRVFVFFPDYGLLAYDLEGDELWRKPLGPFNNVYGLGASPIVAHDRVLLVVDQQLGSFLLALDVKNGDEAWRVTRPEAKSGHSTPVLYRPSADSASSESATEVLVPGSFFLTAYSGQTGEKLWWVRGLSFEMKSTPVLSNGVVYVNGYGSQFNEPGARLDVPPFTKALEEDKNGDGLLSAAEITNEKMKTWTGFVDLDGNGFLDASEWSYFRAALESRNGILAIKAGGRGDLTETNLRWKYHHKVPQLPSPVLYRNVLYMVNDRGIVTTLKPRSGEVIAQGRIPGAVDSFYASPVASDGKVFMAGRSGKVAVLKPDGSLDVLAVNDLDDPITATPAIADGRLYLRTRSALYCFGLPGPQ